MGKYFLNGKEREFKEGSRYIDIARAVQAEYNHDILLFNADGKLKELSQPAADGAELKAITAADKIGMDSYRRSCIFMLMKAIYNTAGIDKIEKVKVLYHMGTSLYIEVLGDVNVDGEFIEKAERLMRLYAESDIPILKRTMATEDAVSLFDSYKMYDKKTLFEFRSASMVNIYSMGKFDDYYFGAMVYSTGFLKYFSLSPYEGGILLNLPDIKEPEKVLEFKPMPKVFAALKEASANLKKMGVETVGGLNKKIVAGELPEIIVTQETLMERKIADIAAMIEKREKCRFVLIAGPSSSGKTTFSRRLSIQLKASGFRPHPISLDDFFLNYADMPLDENGDPDRENIGAVDLDLFTSHMDKLLKGERVEMPHYNFKTRKREYNGKFLQLNENDILVIEGIHGLNDKLSYNLPEESKFKIYVSPITQLNIDERNRVPTTDGRLIRRIVRDSRTRQTDAVTTISWWPGVRKGEEKNIFPYQEEADVIFNSSLVYELSALKLWAEPLLYAVPKDCPEYLEAKKLLKFFNYVLATDNDNIPATSLAREFIGGSCFDAT
ncbi:MAG: nucleoside kinase [Clostridiales bacterium]|nr:nucleoside kinase [Clostridiales bacterium]